MWIIYRLRVLILILGYTERLSPVGRWCLLLGVGLLVAAAGCQFEAAQGDRGVVKSGQYGRVAPTELDDGLTAAEVVKMPRATATAVRYILIPTQARCSTIA